MCIKRNQEHAKEDLKNKNEKPNVHKKELGKCEGRPKNLHKIN